MPPWATRVTTISQAAVVLAGIAAIVVLALERIIDGAGAIAAIMLVTGASAVVTKVVGHVAPPAPRDEPTNDIGVRRG